MLRRPHPIMETSFKLPTSADIDIRLISGAVIFGLGWGIVGFCPGGALPALGTGKVDVAIFIAAMLGGLLAMRFFLKYFSR